MLFLLFHANTPIPAVTMLFPPSRPLSTSGSVDVCRKRELSPTARAVSSTALHGTPGSCADCTALSLSLVIKATELSLVFIWGEFHEEISRCETCKTCKYFPV